MAGRNLITLASLFFISLVAAPQNAVLPFRSAQGLVFVDAEVNGKPACLMLDTGASSSLISYKLAALPKLPEMRNASTSGGEGFSGQAYEVSATLKVGEVRVEHLPVFAGNVENLSIRSGIHVDGLLGEDVLRKFSSVRIDYKAHVIELMR